MQSFKQFLIEMAPNWLTLKSKMSFSNNFDDYSALQNVIDALNDTTFLPGIEYVDSDMFDNGTLSGKRNHYIRVLFNCKPNITMDELDKVNEILNDVGIKVTGDKLGIDNDMQLCFRELPNSETYEYYSIKLYCSHNFLNSLIGVNKKFTFANQIILNNPQFINVGGLGLMLIPYIKFITITGNQTPWAKIIQGALRSNHDLLDVKAELIEQGYSQNAKL
jgi:hypothetical protein